MTSCPPSQGGRRLLEVDDQVPDVLDANRQAQRPVTNATGSPFVGRDRGMGHGGGVESLICHPAKALGEGEEPQAADEGVRRLPAAGQRERDHAAETAHLAGGELVLRMVSQTRVHYIASPCSVPEVRGEEERVQGVPLHPHAERLDACLLYTSDAADEEDSVDLGGRRIIK